jgi:hypothetical protein
MENFIGIGLLAFSIWLCNNIFNNAAGPVTLKSYLQLGVSSIGGFYILYSENKSRLFDLISSLKNKMTQEDKTVDPQNFNIKTNEEKESLDFKCLVYLRNRCIEIGSKEGTQIVSQLNTILFTLDAGKKNE